MYLLEMQKWCKLQWTVLRQLAYHKPLRRLSSRRSLTVACSLNIVWQVYAQPGHREAYTDRSCSSTSSWYSHRPKCRPSIFQVKMAGPPFRRWNMNVPKNDLSPQKPEKQRGLHRNFPRCVILGIISAWSVPVKSDKDNYKTAVTSGPKDTSMTTMARYSKT